MSSSWPSERAGRESRMAKPAGRVCSGQSGRKLEGLAGEGAAWAAGRHALWTHRGSGLVKGQWEGAVRTEGGVGMIGSEV